MDANRREELDRYSARHDCAVAYLLCTPDGRKHLASILRVQFVGTDIKKTTYSAQTELMLGNGSADIFFALHSATDDSWSRRSRETVRLICEVKTGTVIAGEVIRQLRRYERALSKEDLDVYLYGEPSARTTLVLAHCQPVSAPALILLAHEGIRLIDLSDLDWDLISSHLGGEG